MNEFRQRIRTSIENPVLQAALDASTKKLEKGAVDSIRLHPDHAERRERAHNMRENVIADLPNILNDFITNAEANGFHVHRAKDGDEAVQIALKIIGNSPRNSKDALRLDDSTKLIAKSKSMVTEEIELNHALEAAGHRVVETDLGEYIIQLRHEKPSHILAPAVHLRRQEVAELFQKELGIAYTDDIPALTAAAREALRQVFLNADVGISGVNFGVAETGTLCIVTNEGNGRMVTTLPKTHIAIMGMERLVPSMDALALVLSLLPRAATAQKISAYTQFIQRPLDGQTRHLIILDNGRDALRNTSLNDILFCIRCGACINTCPIYREIGGHAYNSTYPGPIGSVLSPGLFGSEYAHLAQACTVCGACEAACPMNIDLPKMLLRVRAGETPKAKEKGAGLPSSVKTGLGLYRRVALHPNLFGTAQKWMGRLAATTKSAPTGFQPIPAWTGWGYSKDFPLPAKKSFRESWQEKKGLQEAGHQLIGQQETEKTISRERSVAAESLSSLFMNEAKALNAEVIALSARELPAQLTAYLHERSISHIQADSASTGYFQNTDITTQTEADPNIAVGVTAAAAAIAETGSILVLGGEGNPLSASLLPEVHIAILQAADLYRTLDEVLAMPALTNAPAASLISGPSRTGDIELTITLGVHGPKELVIFLVDG